MSDANMSGRVQTVLGPIDSAELGVTLAHDHVIFDGSFMYTEPEDPQGRQLAREKISLQNRGWVGYHWTSNRHNVDLDEEDLAISELRRFIEVGGRSIVDPPISDLGANHERYSALRLQQIFTLLWAPAITWV